MRPKPKLLFLHRWVGLGLGLFLIIQALTGTLMVFREELDKLLLPSMTVEVLPTRQAVETIIDGVGGALPGHSITRADFPRQADHAILIRLSAKDGGTPYLAGVDPYTAKVVRHGGVTQWPGEWLFMLHNELWSGRTGHMIVGIVGLGLLFIAITGPIVWWPGSRRIARGLTITFKSGAMRGWRELHRSAGILAAIILLMTASTGVMMIWKEQLRDVIGSFGSIVKKPAPKVVERAGVPFLSIDSLVAKARANYGPSRLQQLRFPGEGGRVVTVYLDSDTYNRPNASKQVWFNRYTGEDLGHYVAGAVPMGNEFIDWLYPIHTGRFLGRIGQILVMLGGIILIGLAATGGWLWMKRRGLEAANLQRRATAPAPRSS